MVDLFVLAWLVAAQAYKIYRQAFSKGRIAQPLWLVNLTAALAPGKGAMREISLFGDFCADWTESLVCSTVSSVKKHGWAFLKGRIDQPLWLVDQTAALGPGVGSWSAYCLCGGKSVEWVGLGNTHWWGFWRARVKQLGLVDWRRLEKGVRLEVVTSDLTKDGGKEIVDLA